MRADPITNLARLVAVGLAVGVAASAPMPLSGLLVVYLLRLAMAPPTRPRI